LTSVQRGPSALHEHSVLVPQMSDSDGRSTRAVLKNCARILINALQAVKLCGGLIRLDGRISLHKMRRQKFYDLLRNFQ
jgi:hypothetical protein